MGTRYHYDRHGNYRGMTSDNPPSNGDGCFWLVVVFIVICLCSGGC